MTLLASCSTGEQRQDGAAQGPTGSDERTFHRESYLIPPEIPVTLIDYILAKKPDETEILSIHVESASDELWILQLTYESRPDRSIVVVKRYMRSGDTWIQG